MSDTPVHATDDSAEPEGAGEIVLYTAEDGRTRVDCRFVDESLWLTQAQMAELFQKDVRTINEHLGNVYEERELDAERTIRKFRIVRIEGSRSVTRVIEHFSLEAVLAVGYRVRSPRGTQFRQWATERLREYLVKGFVMDDERLKSPPHVASGVPDYFDELLERIRDIRASEARIYLRVKEIFALAADYDPKSSIVAGFFRIMQNKLHFAATGHTAAEIVAARSDGSALNMGLTSWKGDRVSKADVIIAKNYLTAGEIGELNRIVVMWLDFAEDQARRRKQVFLADWEKKLDEFLAFNDRDVLSNAGRISHDDAVGRANAEYERFAERRRKLNEALGERELRDAFEEKAKVIERRNETSDQDPESDS
jgi:hypothetical protein